MSDLSLSLLFTAAITLLFFVILGVYSAVKVKTSEEYAVGQKKSGTLLVFGGITGTMIGGASTIGTAQVAFEWGVSAWWFTIGISLGAWITALLLVAPFRNSGETTIQGMIRKEFGDKVAVITAILSLCGIAISLLSQMMSANALLQGVFACSELVCSLIVMLSIIGFVFAGIKGVAAMGVFKFVLLFFAIICCGIYAVILMDGPVAFVRSVPDPVFTDLFADDVSGVLSNCGSMALGILCGQPYVQAVLSGRDHRSAKRAMYLTAIASPIIGLNCTIIGIYMRMAFPDGNALYSLVDFILLYVPAPIAGIVLATLFMVIVGSGAGLAVGMGTVITNDIYLRYCCKGGNSKQTLVFTRIVLFISLLMLCLVMNRISNASIHSVGFLAMGLRSIVLVIPMIFALYFSGRFSSKYVLWGSLFGLISMVLAELFDSAIDSIIVGFSVSLLISLCGKKKNDRNTSLQI